MKMLPLGVQADVVANTTLKSLEGPYMEQQAKSYFTLFARDCLF